VVAIGPEVTRFNVGERVMSRHRLGAFAELGNASAENCDAIPAGLSLEEAAVFRGAYSTAYHALLQRGRLKEGDRVLIHGAAGGIGIPAIQIAKLFGAEVIATASTDEKRAVCRAEGAAHAIDYQGGFRDKVMELTGGRGVDIIYDPVNGPTFEESLRCLAWGGRILILGFLGGAPALARTNYLLIKGIEAIGVRIGGLNEAHPEIAAANTKTLLELAGQGKLKPRIWQRLPLSRAAEAVQALIDRKVIGKVVLE
jgi:NADPH:quinone reductase